MEDWLHPESKSDLVHSCSFYIVLPVVVCSKEMPQLRCGEVSGEAVTLQDMIQDVIKSISFKYIVKTMASTTVPNPHSSLVCSTMDLNHVVSSLATWRQFKKWCLKNSTCHLKYHKKRKRRAFFLTHATNSACFAGMCDSGMAEIPYFLQLQGSRRSFVKHRGCCFLEEHRGFSRTKYGLQFWLW